MCSKLINRQGWKTHKIVCDPPSITLGIYTEPAVLHITFAKKFYFDKIYAVLLEKLQEGSKYLEAMSPHELTEILKTEKPTALLITDNTLMEDMYAGMRAKIVEFAKSGGTVIFCCWFAGTTEEEVIDKMFKTEWDLPWKCGGMFKITMRLNPYRWTKLHTVDLPDKPALRGYYLDSAMKEESVYISARERRANKASWVHDKGRSAVLFTHYGSGWIGFVGDDYARDGSADIICALCGLRNPGWWRTPLSWRDV